jgi:flagellar hook assembly protein FlgD
VEGAWPNPFNPATELRFELAASEFVRAEVLDLRGRLVRTLVAASLDAGAHAAFWDGTDESGRAVASGTYLWRLRAGSRQFTGKMSLVR